MVKEDRLEISQEVIKIIDKLVNQNNGIERNRVTIKKLEEDTKQGFEISEKIKEKRVISAAIIKKLKTRTGKRNK